MSELPRPEITEVNRSYWDALERGVLHFQRCDCGHAWLPPRRECPSCLRASNRWERASGRGTLLSWVVYHTAYHPSFADRLPYNVALVQLAEGPRLLTRLLDHNDRLRGDAAVELAVTRENDVPLATFRLCAA